MDFRISRARATAVRLRREPVRNDRRRGPCRPGRRAPLRHADGARRRLAARPAGARRRHRRDGPHPRGAAPRREPIGVQRRRPAVRRGPAPDGAGARRHAGGRDAGRLRGGLSGAAGPRRHGRRASTWAAAPTACPTARLTWRKCCSSGWPTRTRPSWSTASSSTTAACRNRIRPDDGPLSRVLAGPRRDASEGRGPGRAPARPGARHPVP